MRPVGRTASGGPHRPPGPAVARGAAARDRLGVIGFASAGVAGEPDLDAYLRRTASGELAWELHGVIYEARDEDQTLTLGRENRALILTMGAAGPDGSSATLRSSDACADDRDKWEQLMALVETQAI